MLQQHTQYRIHSFYIHTIILCCLLNLVCCDAAFSQQPNFKNYAGEMLPSVNVYVAFQDSKGFMWFGTDRGAVRFDGYSFTTFTTLQGLSDNEVFNFYEDRSGKIWFLTMNGKLSYFKDDVIYNATSDAKVKQLDFASSITGMLEDPIGNLWISSLRDGMACVHPDGTITKFTDDGMLGAEDDIRWLSKVFNTYSMIYVSPHVFILSKRPGFYRITFNDDDTKVLHSEKIEDSPYLVNLVKTMVYSPDRFLFKIWDEVYDFSVKTEKYTTTYSVPAGEEIYNVTQDTARFWFCTSVGATIMNKRDRKIQATYLPGQRITSVTQDHEGNYWFTTLGEGIFFCTSLSMQGYDMRSGLKSEVINCLSKDSLNRIWLGYGRGRTGEPGAVLSNIKHKKITHIELSTNSIFRRMNTLNISHYKDRMWVSTSAGHWRLTSKEKRVRTGFVRCTLEYPNKNIWTGSPGFLATMPTDSFYVRSMSPELVSADYLKKRNHPKSVKEALAKPLMARVRIMPPANARCIFRDSKNEIWIGTGKHLYHCVNDSVQQQQITPTNTEIQVNDIAEMTDGTLILSTINNGVIFYKGDVNTRSIDENDGMSSNICNAAAIDDDGVIWVGTSQGLNRISGYPDSVRVEYFDTHDGLMSNEVTDVLISDDTVWVATMGGLNFFHKDAIQKHYTAPIMYIDRLTVDGKPIPFASENALALNHNQNDLSIHYTGLSYSNGPKIVYRYKLHRDDPWRFTKNTSVYLPELTAGEYEFIVSAKGRLNEWSKEASMKFTIEEPFWKSTSFILFCVFGFLFFAWIVIANVESRRRKNIEQQHRLISSELKSLRAQMNPHFLFNAMNSIQGVLMKRNIEEAQDYLGRFGKLMRTILDHADKTSISISEELDSITNYLEIEQLRSTKFQYKIELDPALDIYNQEIPAMIIQPFIENSIWHGFVKSREDNLLLLRFVLTSSETLLIEIKDNGIGRKKAMSLRTSTHKSKGMKLVKERIDILNFKSESKIALHIIDLENEAGEHPGTLVQIMIPVNQ